MLTQVNKLLKEDKVDLAKLAQLEFTRKARNSQAEDVEAEIQSANEYKGNVYSAMVGIDELNMKFELPTVVLGRYPTPR